MKYTSHLNNSLAIPLGPTTLYNIRENSNLEAAVYFDAKVSRRAYRLRKRLARLGRRYGGGVA